MPLNQQSCTQLKGVGPKLALRLEKLGIYSIQDLIFHLPLRYQDRTHIIPLGRLRPGEKKRCRVLSINKQIPRHITVLPGAGSRIITSKPLILEPVRAPR